MVSLRYSGNEKKNRKKNPTTFGWTTLGDGRRGQRAVNTFLNGLAAEFFEAGFQKRITRQQKLVEKCGDYLVK